jgi:hypothetical protein
MEEKRLRVSSLEDWRAVTDTAGATSKLLPHVVSVEQTTTKIDLASQVDQNSIVQGVRIE